MYVRSIKSQRGDTIIEVLIALSVLALILVAGYSISTRSINGVRVSQERSEALRVAESQLEQLRGLSSGVATADALIGRGLVLENNGFSVSNSPYPDVKFTPETDASFNAFCIDAGQPVKYSVTNFKDFSQYSADPALKCVVNSRYHVVIRPEYKYVSDVPRQLSISYRVTVYWDRAGGGQIESLNLAYKLTVPEV